MPASAISPRQRGRARKLRREPTEAERRLWRALRLLNRQGAAHFRRQAPVGRHILDFVDFGRKLVIEADGGQHGGPADAARDAWLAGEGFLVLRFWNNDVLANLEGVVDVVTRTLKERPRPHPIPPPRVGREASAAIAGPEPDGSRSGKPERPSASPPPRGEGMGVGLQRSRRSGAPALTAGGGADAED